MDLGDILESDEGVKAPPKPEVSTGKAPVEMAPPGQANAIKYNPDQADLEYKSELVENLPFVRRAIDKVLAAGYDIEPRLSQALIRRHNGDKVFTLHEADILLRGGVDITNEFFQASLKQMTAYVTEDDNKFTTGIFQLRARYNKGIEWYKKSYKFADDKSRRGGLTTLFAISAELESLGLPLHHEEVEAGFHREFLKPEHMNWQDFSARISVETRMASITTKQIQQDRHNEKRGEACLPPVTDSTTVREAVVHLQPA